LRLLVTGASGLIGSAITARLISAGHNVFGLARKVKEAARRRPDAQWRKCDIARMTQSGLWVPDLDGVDAVVNCAGVLHDGPEDSTRGVHADGIAALFAALRMFSLPVSTLGTPRIGTRRELNLALESFWSSRISPVSRPAALKRVHPAAPAATMARPPSPCDHYDDNRGRYGTCAVSSPYSRGYGDARIKRAPDGLTHQTRGGPHKLGGGCQAGTEKSKIQAKAMGRLGYARPRWEPSSGASVELS
jgi:NAD(P)-dependent dehydrogenase (short-subunit alcohol dehydrogenase family)